MVKSLVGLSILLKSIECDVVKLRWLLTKLYSDAVLIIDLFILPMQRTAIITTYFQIKELTSNWSKCLP